MREREWEKLAQDRSQGLHWQYSPLDKAVLGKDAMPGITASERKRKKRRKKKRKREKKRKTNNDAFVSCQSLGSRLVLGNITKQKNCCVWIFTLTQSSLIPILSNVQYRIFKYSSPSYSDPAHSLFCWAAASREVTPFTLGETST